MTSLVFGVYFGVSFVSLSWIINQALKPLLYELRESRKLLEEQLPRMRNELERVNSQLAAINQKTH